MKAAAFDELIAEAYGVELKTVTVFSRALKEAGLMTTGARGVNAPEMTPRDAAIVTIALLSTDRPAQAVEAAGQFGNLKFSERVTSELYPNGYLPIEAGLPQLGIAEGTKLVDALTALFASDDEIFNTAPFVLVSRNSCRAAIEFHHPKETDFQGAAVFYVADRAGADTGIRRQHGLASSELLQVHTQFYLERRDGADV